VNTQDFTYVTTSSELMLMRWVKIIGISEDSNYLGLWYPGWVIEMWQWARAKIHLKNLEDLWQGLESKESKRSFAVSVVHIVW